MYPLHIVVDVGLFSFVIGAALVGFPWLLATYSPTKDCPKCDGGTGEYKGRWSHKRRFEGNCVRCGNTGRVARFGAGRHLREKSRPNR